MMTQDNTTIATRYLQQRDMLCRGTVPEQVLSPWYLMDVMYQIFSKEVATKPLKHEAKKVVKSISQYYKEFNRGLFRLLTPDEADAIIEQMDNCEEYLHNYILMCRCDIHDACVDYKDDDREFLTSVLLCRLISQLGCILWRGIFKTRTGHPEYNMKLEALTGALMRLAMIYDRELNVKNVVDLNKCDKLGTDCRVLTRKLLEFVKKIE